MALVFVAPPVAALFAPGAARACLLDWTLMAMAFQPTLRAYRVSPLWGFALVDEIDLRNDGSFEVLERVEGGKHQVSVCAGAPAVLGWATGNLAEPRNNPQIGMANMRTIMPALQNPKPRNWRPTA